MYVDTCDQARQLLDKRTLTGTKKASDPLFNMAAQYVAAKLNLQGGAAECGITATINAAQALLDLKNQRVTEHTRAT